MDLVSYLQKSEKEDRASVDEYLAAKAAGFPDRPTQPESESRLELPVAGVTYGPPEPFIISQGLITGCHICPQQSNLSRCSACKVVHYCGPEHQATDRPRHKLWCKDIKKITFVMGKDEAALRAHPGDVDTPPRAFETAVGKFWGYQGTRNYMMSKNELIMALGKINTRLAVQTALDHALDLIRLNPQDNMCVRSHVPALFLRLGRDQECYSFCKWWVTVGHDYDYDWKDTRLPHHIMENADAFEPVDAFERVRNFTRPNPNNRNVPSFSDLSHVVAVTLVKIRMLLTLQAIDDPTKAYHPLDTTSKGTSPTYMSPLVTGNPVVANAQNLKVNTAKLEKQVKKLYDSVNRINKHFWPALLKPYYHFTVTPYEYGMGDEEEMQSKLRECFNAWIETPGAIVLIRKLTVG